MLQGLVTALRTLTILRVPGSDAPDMSRALPWFPLVGGLLGLLLWGLASGFGGLAGNWPGGMALVVIAASVILTRGLHLDGLADWADGFGGSRDKEKTLAIMKDSHVGAFGGIAIILVLIAEWTSCVRLVETDRLSWLMTACIVSRFAIVELAASLPYARAEGGTASPFVTGARASDCVKALGLASVLVLITGGAAGLAVLAAGWVFCRLLGFWFVRRVGGVTGDLLGACCELTQTLILVVLAAGGGALTRLLPWKIFAL